MLSHNSKHILGCHGNNKIECIRVHLYQVLVLMESFYCCNHKSSNVNEQTYALFSSFFMFRNTDFRMKTKIEMNMYEYANKLICIY